MMRIAICALKEKTQDAKTANQKESHAVWSMKGFMLHLADGQALAKRECGRLGKSVLR